MELMQTLRRGLLHRGALGRRADRRGEPLLRPGDLHEAARAEL